MSLLDDGPSNRPTNPAKFYLEVKNGAVSYYDKETKSRITVPEPLGFIVLDQLSTIKGWSDSDESGFWSNEVKFVGRDELTVRTQKGMKERGIWRDIKNSPALAGAKFHSAIYIAHQSEEGSVISCLLLKGAALNEWIKFTAENDVKKNKVTLTGFSDAQKGAVKYKVPIFAAEEMDEAERDEAMDLARELRAYHDESLASNQSHEAPVATKKDDVIEEVGDEPINLDDIPF